jgi:hypothetical protein
MDLTVGLCSFMDLTVGLCSFVLVTVETMVNEKGARCYDFTLAITVFQLTVRQ